MLETVKAYIKDSSDIPFNDYYQDYICKVQDQNVISEIANAHLEDVVSLSKLIDRLNAELSRVK